MTDTVSRVIVASQTVDDNSQQTKSRPRGKRNALKHVPPTDDAEFELECKRKQLVTAHAKIHELEAANTKLSKTNHILSERINMFERANGKEMYEQYFPPKPPAHPSDTSAGQQRASSCSPHHCCVPPPCHCYSRCQVRRDTPDIVTKISELWDIVTKTVKETTALRADLATLVKPMAPTTQPQQPARSSDPEDVISPDIIVIERAQNQSTPERHPSIQLDMSISSVLSSPNTIDDNVDDIPNTSGHLNCNVLTNQLL